MTIDPHISIDVTDAKECAVSPVAGCKIGDIRNLLPQAAHWFRFYDNETATE